VISRFFIDRPIFATVLSLIITLAGALALLGLPITQYPEITPPTIEVSTIYPGANAQLVRDTVAEPIEQQISGVENAMYLSSQCTNDGRYRLLVTFKPGTDLNIAQVVTQVRVSLALPILPDLVQREGVSVLKKSPAQLMIVNLVSPDGRYDDVFLSNYATIQLRDELLRLDGVSDVTYMGQRDYSMRVWLDPEKLAAMNLTASDVVNALQQQNVQVAAGNIGQQPVPKRQNFQLTLNALGRLWESDQFGDIILKTTQEGRKGQDATVVRLRDVARIDLGAQQYDQICTLDGKPSVALSIYQLPGSNALQTDKGVRKKMQELKARFPEGLDYQIVYDTTPFIRESIVEVVKTLRDAILLVALVVLIFLQNWRATLIPLIAVPVAIVGTFAAMAAFGFSLNNLSLFGLVLAIGIVVDDAIVVVENVERWLAQGLAPRQAAVRAMEEVTGPVLGVALVLAAVFIPCAFISGIIGQFFRQFALTIAVSTLISAFNSLTLSPALSALLLKHRTEGVSQALPRLAFVLLGAWAGYYLVADYLAPDLMLWLAPYLNLDGEELESLTSVLGIGGGVAVGWLLGRPLNFVLGKLFGWFNTGFYASTNLYTRSVGVLLRLSIPMLLLYGGLLYLTYWSFAQAPTGFIPEQDKGYLIVNVQLPDGASVQRTKKVMDRIGDIAHDTPGVAHTVAISGQSVLLSANASNWGSMYVMLEPFHERHGPALQGTAIADRLRQRCQRDIREAAVTVFGAPPVDGLGTVAGFKLIVEDRGGFGQNRLQGVADALVDEGNQTPGLEGLFTNLSADTPWIYLDIDRTKVKSLGVEIQDVFETLQVNLGSYYVNNFNRFGRSWQVNIMADAPFRTRMDGVLHQVQVRNSEGQMVPLAAFVNVRDISGPALVMRYNMYSAAAINGNVAPGTSSGTGLQQMEELYRKAQAHGEVPELTTYDWTEMAYMQIQSSATAMLLFGLGVVLVFLVLAALYESWSLPLAVILVVPMCLLCSLAGVFFARLDVNIFTQIGFLVLVGLASKNAILIVEFAKQQREEGMARREATLEACRLRLRPILMTSFAFILGVLPLVLAEGAGWEMRQTLGTAVFAGMLGVTLFGIFLTPIFFYVIQWFSDWRRPPKSPADQEPAARLPLADSPAPGKEAITPLQPDTLL
jgi:multidrug efflux pump subunit AcrB